MTNEEPTEEVTGETMRIARFLARCGVAARRKAETLVTEGRVALNGVVITDLGRQVDPASDRVMVDGVVVKLAVESLTLVLNKPTGYVSTRSDPQDRPTVYDLLPERYRSRAGELVHAGRLDFNTTGLLVLTTDGELVHALTHPSQKLVKTYHATTQRPLPDRAPAMLMRGVELEDGPARAVASRFLDDSGQRLIIAIEEGRNRQVRRMIDALGGKCVELRRTAIGGLRLDELQLAEGQFAEMDSGRLLKLVRPPKPHV